MYQNIGQQWNFLSYGNKMTEKQLFYYVFFLGVVLCVIGVLYSVLTGTFDLFGYKSPAIVIATWISILSLVYYVYRIFKL